MIGIQDEKEFTGQARQKRIEVSCFCVKIIWPGDIVDAVFSGKFPHLLTTTIIGEINSRISLDKKGADDGGLNNGSLFIVCRYDDIRRNVKWLSTRCCINPPCIKNE